MTVRASIRSQRRCQAGPKGAKIFEASTPTLRIKASYIQPALIAISASLLTFGASQGLASCSAKASVSVSNFYQLESTMLRQKQAERVEDFDAYAMTEYGLAAYPGFVLDKADAHARDLLYQLRQLGSGFEQLIVDPGILQYLSAFKKFVEGHHNLEPWEARDAFATQKEMQVTVYRGMNLDQAETTNILENGIGSDIRRKNLSTPEISQPHYLQQIRDHIQKMGMSFDVDTDLISVTSYPHIAIDVPKIYAKPNDGKRAHLFEISISKIDLIAPPAARPISVWRFLGSGTDGIILHEKDKPDVLVPLDANVEQMAYVNIPATQIKEIPLPQGLGFDFYVDHDQRQLSRRAKQEHNRALMLKTLENGGNGHPSQ